LFGKDLSYSQKVNYIDFPTDDYDVIICMAGHSSVPMCEHSPIRSWCNNVTNFRNLCDTLRKDQKLIYASSASVYGKATGISTENSSINFNVLNHYDLQKITIDLIANKYISEGKNIIGLRFGTVNGCSPNTRKDLMINSMIMSSHKSGQINVKNFHIRRAILGINDLCNALEFIISSDVKSGQYNLSSFNSTVQHIADIIKSYTGAEIIKGMDDKVTYDFELSTEKFKNETGFIFKDTVESLIEGLNDNINTSIFDVRDNDRNFQFY
jgi:nucleoside-diphosphate-sugar epimerase